MELDKMSLTVVVPYRDGGERLTRLRASIPADVRMVVVDDVSTVRPPAGLYEVVNREERGYFTGAVNTGLAHLRDIGPVLILNQDVEFEQWPGEWIAEQAKKFNLFGERGGAHPAWPDGYIHGVFMYIDADVLAALGGFSTRYPLWGATAEYQVRATRFGFRVGIFEEIPGMLHSRAGGLGDAIRATLDEEPDRHALFLATPPAISVIIPCYNYGRYLQDAVRSLIGGITSLGDTPGQTFQDFDITIVNDASTDDTAMLADALADHLKGIRVIHNQTRQGTAEAMNIGIRASVGQVIAPMDADDMMEPERLERMYTMLRTQPERVIYDNVRYFAKGQRGAQLRFQEYDFERLMRQNFMHCGVIYTRKSWERAGGYPRAFGDGRQDWAFAVALGRVGVCGTWLNEALYLYRREGQGRTERYGTNGTTWAHFYQRMQATFPDIYKGVRPMGCCGSGSRVPAQAANNAGLARSSRQAVSAGSLVLLRYVGVSSGNTPYYGAVTKLRYIFSTGHPEKYVDSRDVEGLLSLQEGRRPVFERAEPR